MVKITCDACGKEMESRRTHAEYPIKINEYDGGYDTTTRTVDICEICDFELEKEIKKLKIRFLERKKKIKKR